MMQEGSTGNETTSSSELWHYSNSLTTKHDVVSLTNGIDKIKRLVSACELNLWQGRRRKEIAWRSHLAHQCIR